ncbi:MAG: hypothetical protein JNM79_02665 [Burkholderiales bacterium]|nr:hypothetical protein [Burkholderiales bacterium]
MSLNDLNSEFDKAYKAGEDWAAEAIKQYQQVLAGAKDPLSVFRKYLIPPTKNLSEYPVILAIGDSWFAFWSTQDALDILNTRHHVWSAAERGKTLGQVIGWPALPPPPVPPFQLESLLHAMCEIAKADDDPATKVRVKAILISAGGNDILDNGDDGAGLLSLVPSQVSFSLVENKASDLIDKKLGQGYAYAAGAVLEASKVLFKGRAIPVIMHGYADPIPDGRGAGDKGPWIKPHLEASFSTLNDRFKFMQLVIGRLHALQTHLAKRYKGMFSVDLRPALTSKIDPPQYKMLWQDELHPTAAGYQRVAQRYGWELKKVPFQ